MLTVPLLYTADETIYSLYSFYTHKYIFAHMYMYMAQLTDLHGPKNTKQSPRPLMDPQETPQATLSMDLSKDLSTNPSTDPSMDPSKNLCNEPLDRPPKNAQQTQKKNPFHKLKLDSGPIFLRRFRLYVLCFNSCLKTYVLRKIITARLMLCLW